MNKKFDKNGVNYMRAEVFCDGEKEPYTWDNDMGWWLDGEPAINKRDALAAIAGCARNDPDFSASNVYEVRIELFRQIEGLEYQTARKTYKF